MFELNDRQKQILQEAIERKDKTSPYPWVASPSDDVDTSLAFREIEGFIAESVYTRDEQKAVIGVDCDWKGKNWWLSIPNPADAQLIVAAPEQQALIIYMNDIIKQQAARIVQLEEGNKPFITVSKVTDPDTGALITHRWSVIANKPVCVREGGNIDYHDAWKAALDYIEEMNREEKEQGNE